MDVVYFEGEGREEEAEKDWKSRQGGKQTMMHHGGPDS